MGYTLEQLSSDCHDAIVNDPGPAGREIVRQCIARACGDSDFVASQFPSENTTERKAIYTDPSHGFTIFAHVYKGAKSSNPHDHESTWAIYGQAVGSTVMTDWRKVQEPNGDEPGKVEKVKSYEMTPGIAHVYQEGDLHSPERETDTCLIRVEGKNMDGVRRDKYVVA
jgi:predicted metal-dependent enzyme (double-stranded beta helix superfamily)